MVVVVVVVTLMLVGAATGAGRELSPRIDW